MASPNWYSTDTHILHSHLLVSIHKESPSALPEIFLEGGTCAHRSDGWESLIFLEDLRGLEQGEAKDVLAFAARAVVHAVLRTKR